MIVAAALRLENGLIASLPAPARHVDIIADLSRCGMRGAPAIDAEQGFITSNGQFVDRVSAGKIALSEGQIERLQFPDGLYSEELW